MELFYVWQILTILIYIAEYVYRTRNDPVNIELFKEGIEEASHLIQRYGYPAENHTVETIDGWNLTIHRIPYGKKRRTRNGPPVLLLHGLAMSSSSWFMTQQGSIGFILADEGFDVWAGNFRGNPYTKHKFLSENNKTYWDFGPEELGIIDVPAFIDFVLNKTGHKKLFLYANSIGSTVGFGFLSLAREYNDKVAGFFAVGPTTSCFYQTSIVGDARTSASKYFLNLIKFFQFGKERLGFLPDLWKNLLFYLCPHDNTFICQYAVYGYSGFNRHIWNTTRVLIYALQSVIGTSTKNFQHVMQNCEKGTNMSRFDYGRKGNMKHYHSPKPPQLELELIKSPIVLVHGANDPLANPLDTALLARRLKNLKADILLEDRMTSHTDEMLAINAREMYMNRLVQIMRELWKE